MRSPLLSSLFVVAVLAIVAPMPSHAALYCKAQCSGGSCACVFCNCGCNGGSPWCGDRQAALVHANQDTLARLEPFSGTTGEEVDFASIELVRGTEHGEVRVADGGTFFYSPEPGFTGLDSFSFSVCNHEGECDVATVLVDVLPKK